MSEENKQLLTDEQAQKFIMALAEHRGEQGFSKEDAEIVLKWATETVLSQVLFEGVMRGDMYVDVIDGEAGFGLTNQGTEFAEALKNVPYNSMGTVQ